MENKSIATMIEDLCKEKGMSQKELAQKLNISRSIVSQWIRGVSIPKLCELEGLSRVLEIPIEDFISCAYMNRIPSSSETELVIKEIIAYSKLEDRKKTYRHRQHVRITLGCVTACLLLSGIAALLLMPSQGGGSLRRISEYTVSPYGASEELYLYIDAYVAPSTTKEYILTKLSNEELLEVIEKYNPQFSCYFLGTASAGAEHYLFSARHPLTGQSDYFGYVAYEGRELEGSELNYYQFLNCSITFYADSEDLDARNILFPIMLLDDPEPRFLNLMGGERYPVLADWTSREEISTFLYDFYRNSQWNTVQYGENGELVVSPAPLVRIDADPDDRDLFCEDSFSIAVNQVGSRCYLTFESVEQS